MKSSALMGQESLQSSSTDSRRLDIQGLRAIAVLMVVTFHAGLPVPGGFVGVDVFFVISGFVITGMLHRERIRTGRIGFRSFYLKRFKRLTPALALMVGITLIISSIIFTPFGHQTYAAATGIGAMLLSANFVIARTTGGYFAPTAENNPLLNTWSLSVEEQFYLVFPALIAIGWFFASKNRRLRFGPVVIVGLVAIASFILAMASSSGVTFPYSEWILGFYSPFTRAWEFAVGALLALALIAKKPTLNRSIDSRISTALALIGLAMLASSLWLISESTTFPGPWTLLPITGTLLLLFAGAKANSVSQALSTAPMVKMGDWSYSIYLWHWPFIVFAIYLWPFSPFAAIVAAFASLAPALASYHWVEQPIRQHTFASRTQVAKLIAFTMLPPILFAGLMGATAKYYWQPRYLSGEKPSLRSGDTFPEGNGWEYLQDPYFPCEDVDKLYLGTFAPTDDKTTLCGQSKQGTPIDVAILGDSHAAHLFSGVAGAVPDKNVAYFALSGKLPIADGGDMSRLIDRIAQDPDIKTVIVNAYWAASNVPSAELAQTLSVLTSAGKKVFVTDDLPDFPFAPDQCKYGISPLLPIERCTQEFDNFSSKYSTYHEQLQSAIDQVPGAEMLNTAKYFCSEQTCSMAIDDTLVYADDDHLNHQGSAYVIERLLDDNQAFRQALVPVQLSRN